jgi:hypothetical protein
MMFSVNNLDNFQANCVVHGMNIRAKHQFHRPTVNLPCIQKGVFYSDINIFYSLPPLYFEIPTGETKVVTLIT